MKIKNNITKITPINPNDGVDFLSSDVSATYSSNAPVSELYT